MRHFLGRMFLGGLLCAVALITSGCFLRLVSARVDVTTIGEEVRQVVTAVFANATVAVCADLRGTFSDTAVDCTYAFGDEESGVASVTSTAELIHDFGLFGVIIDPVILQVPQDVTSVSGTFAKPGETPRSLIVTTAASFFAQPGTQLFPEAGQKFVIVDFPADALAALTTTSTAFDFTFQFTRLLSISQPPPTSMSVKAMFTGKIETSAQTFYLPLFPCVTDFAQVPALTIQTPGTLSGLLSQFVSLLRANTTLACNNAVYDVRTATEESLGPATLWVGLKNSDDQGTRFDLRAEVYANDTLVVAGESRCITGLTRNPDKARPVTIPLGAITGGAFDFGDVLSLKVRTRIGTTPDGRKCSGPGGSHNSARGLRLYYDSAQRPSGFEATITANPSEDLFLHSDGGPCTDVPGVSAAPFLDAVTPPLALRAKCRDSAGIDFSKGNPWKDIGTWRMTLP